MSEHENNPGPAMPDEQLEARLAGLTEWTGSTEGPLARALAATGGGSAPRAFARAAGRRLREVAGRVGASGRRMKVLGMLSRWQWAAVLTVGAVGVVVAAALMPTSRNGHAADQAATNAPFNIREAIDRVRALQVERKYAEAMQVCDQILFVEPNNPTGLLLKDVLQDMRMYRNVTPDGEQRGRNMSSLALDNSSTDGRKDAGANTWRYAYNRTDVPELDLQASFFGVTAGEGKPPFGEPKLRAISEGGQLEQTPAGRQIIRRGQVELVAADVQVAFRRAQDLIKPERGEFVQDSVLSGSGQAMTARVVLRVDPSRLAEVMQASRGLGELAAEQTGGDDVTERLTDLEAQIRNEQRVEKEMLELFDLRKDAPLKDVLELREQLARVRGNIERMQAQRSQTERLVSLATLAVMIRPQPDTTVAPPPVDETPSFSARVSRSVSNAWERGTNSLAGSAGWLVETVIGGAPVWGTLAVTGVVIWRIVRRRKKTDSPQSR